MARAPGLFSANGRGHDIAGGDEVDLTGDECRDGRIVVLERLYGRGRRRHFRELLLSMAPRVAPTVLPARSSTFDTVTFFAPNTRRRTRIGDAEINHLFTLGVLPRLEMTMSRLPGLEIGRCGWRSSPGLISTSQTEIFSDQIGHYRCRSPAA